MSNIKGKKKEEGYNLGKDKEIIKTDDDKTFNRIFLGTPTIGGIIVIGIIVVCILYSIFSK
jgi:hypothetical protein